MRPPHLGPALALAVGLLLFCMGTPGLTQIAPRRLTAQQTHMIKRRVGAWALPAAAGLAKANAAVRRPLNRLTQPLWRTFRVKQNWHLYGDGPYRVRRIEVVADGALLYRSHDPDHSWRAHQLEYRRMRPLLDAAAVKVRARHWSGVARFLVDAVREDHPHAKRIEIWSTKTRYGQDEVQASHGRVALAPLFDLELADPADWMPRP